MVGKVKSLLDDGLRAAALTDSRVQTQELVYRQIGQEGRVLGNERNRILRRVLQELKRWRGIVDEDTPAGGCIGICKQSDALMRAVFPEPVGPTILTTSPMERSIPRTGSFSPVRP